MQVLFYTCSFLFACVGLFSPLQVSFHAQGATTKEIKVCVFQHICVSLDISGSLLAYTQVSFYMYRSLLTYVGLFSHIGCDNQRNRAAGGTEHMGRPQNELARYCNALQHTLQHIGTLCNTLQHSATLCSTLQQTATYSSTRAWVDRWKNLSGTATHCNTRSNVLEHTAILCNTLKHSTTHCSKLQHTAAHVYGQTLKRTCQLLQHTATHTITHCNTH